MSTVQVDNEDVEAELATLPEVQERAQEGVTTSFIYFLLFLLNACGFHM